MRKVIVLCLVLSFMGMNNSFAANRTIKKLQRGVVNIVTAPVEIPKQIRVYWIAGSEKTFHISAWIFCGLVKGIWMIPVRAGSGLWDVISSPLDIPSNGKSIVQPPYVFDDWPQRKAGVIYHNMRP